MAGERFIASGRFMKMIEIAEVLRAELGPQASRVPTRVLPDWLVRLVALFNPVARAVVGELGSIRNQDASHARKCSAGPRGPRRRASPMPRAACCSWGS
jgi:dihydroflavonol-4-reductase